MERTPEASRVRRNPGSIMKQNKSLNSSFVKDVLMTQETQSIRNKSPYGKIIKNSRVKESSFKEPFSEKKDKKAMKEIYLELKEPEMFSNKKLKLIEDKYQKRFTAYESCKKSLINEIREVSRSKNKGKIKRKGKENSPIIKKNKEANKDNNQRKDHFFLSKLRQTVSIIKKAEKIRQKETEEEFSFEKDLEEELLPKRKFIQQNIADKQRIFFTSLQRMIGFEERLRHYKNSITYENKREITSIIESKSLGRAVQLLKIDFEEYQFEIQKQQKLSAETIAEGILQLSQKCQHFWKEEVKRNLNEKGAKELFEYLNYDKEQIEVSLKTFTREINSILGKNYKPQDFYRIHQRLSPLTKGNFIYHFSQIC